MVSTLSWVLVGIGAYWVGVLWLRRNGLLPDYVGTQGPVLTVHTGRFRSLVDRLSRPRRLWRAWGNFGVGVAVVVMAASFLFLAFVAVSQLRDPAPATAVNQPRNFLVIPGVNDFLPLAAAPEIVLGLLVGLVVHEGGHGIFCRVGDIEIKSMGLAFLAFIPIGAFVEPDEDSRRAADRGDQTRMFAAGVMNNFAITLVAFALLFGPVMGAITVAPGAAVGGVYPGSPAAAAGLDGGDRVVAVNGDPVDDNAGLESALRDASGREVAVTVADRDGTREATVTRSLLVVEAAGTSPLAAGLADEMRAHDPGDPVTISAVNGTPVATERDLWRALADRPVAAVRTGDGRTITAPMGADITVIEDGPLAGSTLAPGTAGVVTAVDGHRVPNATALGTALDDTRPGDTVPVVVYVDGERREVDVALGEHPTAAHGFLGVQITRGVSGVEVTDFGARLYPAGVYRGLLGGGDGAGIPFFGRVIVALQLPLASVAGVGLPFNFAGFVDGVQNFYEVTGPLGAFGGLAFTLANALFWTGWINLNLGVFNCIPAFPLDGGHILRMGAEGVVSRLPVDRRRDLTTAITTSVGVLMLASLVLMVFGPRLLG